MRKLMTFNTVKGVCSLSVNLNDLKKPSSSLTPVRKTSAAMPGVTHYEAEPKKIPKSKSLDDHRFGYTGKSYRKAPGGGGGTKIPVFSGVKSNVDKTNLNKMEKPKILLKKGQALSDPSLAESTRSSGTENKVRKTLSTDLMRQ